MNELLFFLLGLACFAAVGGLTLGCSKLMPARPGSQPQPQPQSNSQNPLGQQAGAR